MGWGGIGQAIFDPLNISGAFGSQSSSLPVPDNTPSTWNGPNGFMGGMVSGMKGKVGQLPSIHNPDPNLQLDLTPPPPPQAPFQSQWQFQAGKGPQWTEPQTSDGGKTWQATPSPGPAKGNRF